MAELITSSTLSGDTVNHAELARMAGYAVPEIVGTDCAKSKNVQRVIAESIPLDKIIRCHDDLLSAKSENIQMQAVKLGYRVHGAFDRDRHNKQNFRQTNIAVSFGTAPTKKAKSKEE